MVEFKSQVRTSLILLLWFQGQFYFQSLCDALWIYLVSAIHWPIWDLGSVLSCNSVIFRIYCLLSWVRNSHVWLSCDPWSSYTSLWSPFPKLLPLLDLFSPLWFTDAPLLDLIFRKWWLFFFFFFFNTALHFLRLCHIRAKMWKDRVRKKISICPMHLRPQEGTYPPSEPGNDNRKVHSWNPPAISLLHLLPQLILVLPHRNRNWEYNRVRWMPWILLVNNQNGRWFWELPKFEMGARREDGL